MQKLDENGNKLWGDEPVIIDHGNGSYYLGFDVESDQNGGAYIIYSIPPLHDTVHLAHLIGRAVDCGIKPFIPLEVYIVTVMK